MNPLLEFERHSGLSVKDAATLLGLPAPTYYQYRRSGNMPGVVVRFVEVLTDMPTEQLDTLIRKYLNDDQDEL